MGRVVALGYGILVYVVFLVGFALLAGFLAGASPLWHSDGGAPTPWPAALAIDVALLALFGVSHSLLARPRWKARLVRVVPEPAWRATYVLVATATLVAIMAAWRPLPAPLWDVAAPSLRAAIFGLQALAIGFVVVTTFHTNHFEFVGLRQLWLHARGRPYTALPFAERGAYKLVRHPMMLGLLVWFWAAPAMSVGHGVFALGMTIYIVVGVRLEERDLARALGDAYAGYRARVPALVPRLRGGRT